MYMVENACDNMKKKKINFKISDQGFGIWIWEEQVFVCVEENATFKATQTDGDSGK